MDALELSRHYWRKARKEHGTPLGDMYYSIAEGYLRRGFHPQCESCKAKCKKYNAPNLAFDCRGFRADKEQI